MIDGGEVIRKLALNVARYSGLAPLARPLVGGIGAILMLHRVTAAPEKPLGVNRHLNIAPDFLDAVKHPLIRFVARDYRAGSDGDGILRGDLTLLGQTHPVEGAVTVNKAAKYPFGHGRHTLGVSARAKLKRSQWGMSYGVGNGMVGDEVELLFEFEALRQ